MTKPLPGIPTRRQRSTSTSSPTTAGGGGGDKTSSSNKANGATTSGGGNSNSDGGGNSSRPRRLRGRGLPLMTKKPSIAASALAQGEETDTSSETEENNTPKKLASSSGGGFNRSDGGSSFQTPSPNMGAGSTASSSSSGFLLAAVNKRGRSCKVKLIVNGDVFNPSSKMAASFPSSGGGGSLRKRTLRGSTEASATMISTTTTSNNEILVEAIATPPGSKKLTKTISAAGVPLGQDGNLFQCCVCAEFGDVVCCDGCPNVYHKTCLDVNDPSRIALDNDEDPWYCPGCRGKGRNKKHLKEKQRSTKGQFVSQKKSKKIKNKFSRLTSPTKGEDGGEGISNDHDEIDDGPGTTPAAVASSSKDGEKNHDASTKDLFSSSKKKKDKRRNVLPVSSPTLSSKEDAGDGDAEGVATISQYNDAEEDENVVSPAATTSSATSATPTSFSSSKKKDSAAKVKTEESNQDQDDEVAVAPEVDTTTTPEKVDSSSPSAAAAGKKNDDPKLSSLTSSKKKKKRKRNLLDEVRDSMTPEDAMIRGEEGDGEGGDEKRRRTRSASTASIDDVILDGEDEKQKDNTSTAADKVSSSSSKMDNDPSSLPPTKKSRSGKAVLPKSSSSGGFVVPTPKRKKKKKKDGDGESLKTPPPSSAKKNEKAKTGGSSEDDPPLISKKEKSKKKSRSMLPKSSRDSPTPAASPSNDDVDAASPSPASSMGAASPPLTDSAKKSKKKKDKKKKKKKKPSDMPPEDDDDDRPPGVDDDDDSDDGAGILGALMRGAAGSGPAKATPAFFFFLGESRPKVERHLSRKHRFFNRLPKGPERNALIAKEAASWWVKLRPTETRRYINMSMREFEQRIIEWKEEKNIKEMLMESDQNMDGEGGTELSLDDEMLTQKNHDRLYLGTTVGFKPFKPEPDESHNRVLLELLQDMRFHPVPMMMAKRTESEYGQMDFDRITIPYFDVHGPVSTSVGDECFGCTRGWTHFCNVLKRRVPAVEHRAKLQPPLSSLVATRIGLGMRPKPQEEPPTEEKPKSSSSTTSSGKEDEKTKKKKKEDSMKLFEEREVEEAQTSKHLPWVPWDSMKEPSERADDIVQFIEEAISMKVAEPPRPGPDRQQPPPPPPPEDVKKTMMPRAILPTRGKKKQPPPEVENSVDPNEDLTGTVNKCGRCRTIINSDTGCIQCRRAQLVINMSKRAAKEEATGNKSSSSSSKAEKGPLKVQTYMLGRINMKEGTGEVQCEGDQAIANGIIRQRWNPCVVLPPHTLDAPTPRKRRREGNDDESVDDDDEAHMICPEVPKDPSSSATSEKNSGQIPGAATAGDTMNMDPPTAPTAEEGSDESGSRPASKRIRSARIGAKGATAEPLDDEYRLLLARRYKEEADELHKKCLNVACCGILLGLMRRDPLLLFASPVTAEGYSTIIKNPIDFEKIRSNVLSGKYVTLGSFVSDARLLCTNALLYNPPGSIYWKTAKELYDVLAVMQKRASNWMGALKDSHACSWRRAPKTRAALSGSSSGISSEDGDKQNGAKGKGKANPTDDFIVEDPFEDLRKTWPEGVEMLENSDWLRKCIEADFMRTKENESAYYGALACRRAAVAAEASLAPYPDSSGIFNPIGRRNHLEDEHLRKAIDEKVSQVMDPVELKELPTWREESIVRVMRRAQSRRLEGLIGSVNGCARCDGMRVDTELKMAMTAEANRSGRSRRKHLEKSRVHRSRVDLSTGLGSQNTMKKIKENKEKAKEVEKESRASRSAKSAAAAAAAAKKVPKIGDSPPDVAVMVRGSRVHGWGLFADQPFKSGDTVAEYVGEYVSLAVTEAREKVYQEQRIQDYQFRLDDQLVIDATMHGGHGRYINHNCSPNCIAKIIPGKAPNEHLKRVVIIAQRDIKPREELTYDYQFPLELDLDARIPCNCHSEHCRGFMNWDLPEKGANSRVLRTQKRGANMRDRIRRLGRPLKSDK